MIRSVSAPGKCIDIRGAVSALGTQATNYRCHGGSNQLFSWQANGEIRVYGTMCLDAQQGQNWSRVVIQPCAGGASQRLFSPRISEAAVAVHRGLRDPRAEQPLH